MLLLSRMKNERIVIGDDIIITVLEIRGGKVRLAITAPNHVPIDKLEVVQAVNRQKATPATEEKS